MDGAQIIILAAAVSLGLVGAGYVAYTAYANRKFKPIEIKQAEELVSLLIRKKYGRKKNSLKEFYADLLDSFPDLTHYNYYHILSCLNPRNDRKNPDIVEAALRVLGKTYIVEGSITHLEMEV